MLSSIIRISQTICFVSSRFFQNFMQRNRLNDFLCQSDQKTYLKSYYFPLRTGSRPGSRGSSNASAVSARSTLAAATNADAKPTANNNCADSNQTLIITNIIENPAAESVTIEILQPKSEQKQETVSSNQLSQNFSS